MNGPLATPMNANELSTIAIRVLSFGVAFLTLLSMKPYLAFTGLWNTCSKWHSMGIFPASMISAQICCATPSGQLTLFGRAVPWK